MGAATTCRQAPGFFGKLPSHGDFLTRRLPAAFTDHWDAWLQAGMADSRARLDDAWLALYLNSPIWRFVLGAGVCGPQAVGGVMMPSVDRVGRFFPFTVAACLDGGACAAGPWRVPAPGWYAALEALALPALSAGFSLSGLDAALLAQKFTYAGGELPGAVRAACVPAVGADDGRALFWTGDDTAPLAVWAPAPSAALFTHMLSATSLNQPKQSLYADFFLPVV